MKKKGNSFVCDVCGYESGKWFGRCPQCGEWNSVKEIIVSDKTKRTGAKQLGFLSLKTANYESISRIDSGFEHLNRVLGGGLVGGSVILIGGDPGVGKSTLVTQLCANFEKSYYISGEESFEQIFLRYQRVTKDNSDVHVMNTSFLDTAIEQLEKDITHDESEKVVIVDSIQTMKSSDVNSLPGGAVQISIPPGNPIISYT